jgi:formate hydrogenlyase subunit 3/multisubunit Na+/H+ antiporter MnhD subunit
MAYAEQSPRLRGPINEHASALAHEWRRLTRAATAVALITSPALFLVVYRSDHIGLVFSLLITVVGILMFRGLVEVVVRKLIPSPNLYGADDSLRQDDLIARRRYWYWRGKFRRLPIYALIVLGFFALCQALFAFAGVSAPFFDPFAGLRTLYPPDQLPQLALILVQLPMLLLINFGIFFGPFLFFAIRQIRSYEPGDASWE